MTTTKDPFEGAPIIFSYTDADAQEDGLLVAIDRKNRVTRAVFDFLTEAAPHGAKPPDRWPVDLFGWFRAKDNTEEGRMAKAVALAKGLIGSHEPQARKVYDENIGGGIWTAYAPLLKGELVALVPEADAKPHEMMGKKLWLIPNELAGVTLMFPEDY